LFAALVLGVLFERLKQSAILGYLLAGVLLGPNAFNLMPSYRDVATMAELGVALLLFTIGLEFSWRRLRSIGAIAFGGGTVQVLLTGALATGACMIFGVELRSSIAIGAMIALSSTAAVLRLLASRAEIDSIHGRNALGILLLQDIAVVPLVILVTVLGRGDSIAIIGRELSRAVVVAVVLVGVLYLLLNYLVPRLLKLKEAAVNREFPILIAIVVAIGSAWASHKLGLSPVLGAFVAGLLLAECPFATQIRADIAPLRTLFLTLFFSSVGMVCNPAWIVENWLIVAVVVAAIVFGKAVIVSGVARLFRSAPGNAVATGVCLAQVGEFSFVLAEVARQSQLIGSDLFELIIAVTVGTLFLTPYLVSAAPLAARFVCKYFATPLRTLHPTGALSFGKEKELSGHIVIVGFGPAGQRVAETLMEKQESLIVVELNPKTASKAQIDGIRTFIGNSTSSEVIEQLHLEAVKAVVVTVPDPSTVSRTVELIRSLSPEMMIIVRARYHIHSWQLRRAGANVIVDEEEEVGLRIAAETLQVLGIADSRDKSQGDARQE